MQIEITASLENYLESILLIQQKQKIVRVKDLSQFSKVKAPSVIEALGNLKKKGLVKHEKYGDIELTPKGQKLAKNIYQRHKILKKFFKKFLGINDAIAEKDACKIEHYLSKTTINRICQFIHYAENASPQGKEWLNNFFIFLQQDTIGE